MIINKDGGPSYKKGVQLTTLRVSPELSQIRVICHPLDPRIFRLPVDETISDSRFISCSYNFLLSILFLSKTLFYSACSNPPSEIHISMETVPRQLRKLQGPQAIQKPAPNHHLSRKTACQACYDRKKRCIPAPPHRQCKYCLHENQKCVSRERLNRYASCLSVIGYNPESRNYYFSTS